MRSIEKLLGGGARLKLLRFFMLNPQRVVTAKEAAYLARVSSRTSSREISFLRSIGFLKKGSRIDVIERRKKTLKKRVVGVALAEDFPHLAPLRNLVIDASPISREKMLKFFKERKIFLVVLGGIFVNKNGMGEQSFADDTEPKLDLLVVGKGSKRSAFEPFIKRLEAEIGKELQWACLATSEFEYRMAMHDKFLRDLFDYEHELLINKLGIE